MMNARVLICALFLLQCCSLFGAERHAFIVGNGTYNEGPLSALANPRKDATDMANALRRLDYQIYSGEALLDLDNRTFGKELSIFASQLPRDSTALVYFAGHGVGYNGDNFLMPVASNVQYAGQLNNRAISVRSIVDLLKNRPGDALNIILLDACRDNPLKTRGSSGGLNTISNIPRGTFIGYAAEPGKTAVDGNGSGNGVYTGELLKALESNAEEPIESVHKKVAESVYNLTGGAQLPSYESLLLGDYCFAMCRTFVLPPIERAEIKEEKRFKPWMAILGAVVAGALLASAGGSDNSRDSDSFTLTLDPPTQ